MAAMHSTCPHCRGRRVLARGPVTINLRCR
jgi:hypothetical protein